MVIHVKEAIAQIFLSSVGIYIISLIMPDFHIDNIFTAFFLTSIILLQTLIFWPLLLKLIKRFLFITFLIVSFLLSVLILWLTDILLPGVVVGGWSLITAPIAIDFVSAIIIVGLKIDDNEIYARSTHYELKRRIEKTNFVEKSGFVFICIDGLSEKVLKIAIAKGAMPTLATWLENGSHKIKGWETDFSSQTGAGVAGILHGCNKDIPAFRWVDKSDNNRIVSANDIADTPMIQKRISDGNGLLSVNGAAIVSLFTGDSEDNVLVFSKLKKTRQLYSESWNVAYSKPFNLGHIVVLFLVEILLDIKCRYRQWRNKIQPRLKSNRLTYFFARAATNVFLQEISTYMTIGNIIAGEKDTIYTTFLGYDEIAHYYGVTDQESFDILKRIDRQICRIDTAKKYGKRPYFLCILSDHGQSNGATFKQRYGITLDELIQTLLPEKNKLYQELNSNKAHFSQVVSLPSKSLKYKVTRVFKGDNPKEAQVIVLASGNVGLIYFTNWKHRLTMEEIEQAYPKLIPGLLNHKGIELILVRSQRLGPLVLSARGKYYLDNDKIEGENPLAKFGENAAEHIRRTESFNNVPDLLLMSRFDPEKDEVSAFEELIGSHGGLGGDQTKPFIMYPTEWNLSNEPIIGAEKVYEILKNKTEDVLNQKDG